MPIKDLTEVHGWPLSYGSRGRTDEPWEGPSEVCVDAFQRAGFVLACKTNTPEFGHITATENLRFGPSRNPWDPQRTPGGSSGGAAAATAGGMFPAAHANDGGGSIRIPASCCGLVGLKPSRGRVPRLSQSWLGAVVEGLHPVDPGKVTGGVSRGGIVSVRITVGASWANGSGRLVGNFGAGRWSGFITGDRCSGIWQASRS